MHARVRCAVRPLITVYERASLCFCVRMSEKERKRGGGCLRECMYVVNMYVCMHTSEYEREEGSRRKEMM